MREFGWHAMDVLEALLNRTSVPKLTDPPPNGECLENICQAALRAADHGVLRPWRFLLISGDSRHKLGDLFVEAAAAKDPTMDSMALERVRQKPLRAPLIIVSISNPQSHPKVPEIEQDLSTAAATQNMLLAAFAQSIGAFWRTGSMAYDSIVKSGLGLSKNEKIVGFLYLGRQDCATKRLMPLKLSDYFQDW